MRGMALYLWQSPDWPRWQHDAAALQPVLSRVRLAQGRMLGLAGQLDLVALGELQLQGWADEAIATAQRLLAQGRRVDTPVVVIENCSRPDQRIVRLTLSALAHGLGDTHGPVLVMLGDAMATRAHQAIEDEAAVLLRHA